MGQIRWTEKASSNLQAIHEYISRDSINYANRFIKTLISKTQKLKSMPFCGRVVPELNDSKFREVLFQHYRIVYRVIGISKDIEILAVTHDARLMYNELQYEWEL